jgi:hypothetical protein
MNSCTSVHTASERDDCRRSSEIWRCLHPFRNIVDEWSEARRKKVEVETLNRRQFIAKRCRFRPVFGRKYACVAVERWLVFRKCPEFLSRVSKQEIVKPNFSTIQPRWKSLDRNARSETLTEKRGEVALGLADVVV